MKCILLFISRLSDSYYHCATKYHEFSSIEQQISYLTVLWIKELMHSLAGTFACGGGVPHKAPEGIGWICGFISRLN